MAFIQRKQFVCATGKSNIPDGARSRKKMRYPRKMTGNAR